MTRVRRLIVAGSRELAYTFGVNPSATDYDRVRDAIWTWERDHGSIERIASGTGGYIEIAQHGGSTKRVYGHLTKYMDGILRITGADLIGEWFARTHGVPVDRYPFMQEAHMRGPKRNARMVADSIGLVSVRYGDSREDRDIVRQAHAAGLPVVDVVLKRTRST